MGCRLAAGDEAPGVFDLARGEGISSAAKVFACCAAFADTVGDAFAFDVELHLSQGGHDSEDHGAHGGAGIDVSAAKVTPCRGESFPAAAQTWARAAVLAALTAARALEGVIVERFLISRLMVGSEATMS